MQTKFLRGLFLASLVCFSQTITKSYANECSSSSLVDFKKVLFDYQVIVEGNNVETFKAIQSGSLDVLDDGCYLLDKKEKSCSYQGYSYVPNVVINGGFVYAKHKGIKISGAFFRPEVASAMLNVVVAYHHKVEIIEAFSLDEFLSKGHAVIVKNNSAEFKKIMKQNGFVLVGRRRGGFAYTFEQRGISYGRIKTANEAKKSIVSSSIFGANTTRISCD